tara:strand:+ start:643 stop:1578 length:936 start_codon:yes stop_codon:yes gene_type:complete
MSEHYVTVFNHKFLPQGMALHESMVRHCHDFILWIICVDTLVYDQLSSLNLDNVKLLNISEIDDDRLTRLQNERTLAEFCWTLTPLSFTYVMNTDLSIDRVTYLDADLFFYNSPTPLFDELENAQKTILITEHAYDPRDDRSAECGIYCVQFVTFYREINALELLKKWQNQCIERCISENNGVVFGDQMYLNDWPRDYGELVHVLEDRKLALGPWNADYLSSGDELPVFYHFHSFRIISNRFLLLLVSFKVMKSFNKIYPKYWNSVIKQMRVLEENNIEIPYLPYPKQKLLFLYIIKRVLFKDNIFKYYKL